MTSTAIRPKRVSSLRSLAVLALMYAAFISLGLPDSLLGASWPVMQPDFGVPYGLAGVASMVVAVGTIVSSFNGGLLVQRLGAGALTRISVAMTATALCGFSLAPSFGWLLVFAVPLGLGAGAVDAALNHFVATHYKAHHMNWLHSFWGVGAMTGPVIVARFIAGGGSWRDGYLAVSLIQGFLVALLLAAIPLWREIEGRKPLPPGEGDGPKRDDQHGETGQREGAGILGPRPGLRSVYRLPGATYAMLTFLMYAGVETTMGLWGSSFLVKARSFGAVDAAFGVSLFYGSLTAGRILSGFASMRVSGEWMIRASLIVILAGAAHLVFSSPSAAATLLGFALVGLGCAAIFPMMLHLTPQRFGARWAPVMMGAQMGTAYTGAMFLPPAFGFGTERIGLWILPFAILIFTAGMLICTERLNALGAADKLEHAVR